MNTKRQATQGVQVSPSLLVDQLLRIGNLFAMELEIEIQGCLSELQRVSAQTASFEMDVDRLREERSLQIERIDRLSDDVRKIAAKANSALDTALRAERECYYLIPLSDVLASVEVLLSRLDQCKARMDEMA